jgi:hypothetical protein
VTFDDATVTAGNAYAYELYATGDTANSAFAGPASVTVAADAADTLGTGTVPNGPYGLALTPNTTPEIRVQFYDNASDETGFIIERATGSGAAAGPFARVGTLPASDGVGQLLTFIDRTVESGTTYTYRVYAVNGPLQSSVAGPLSGTTPGVTAVNAPILSGVSTPFTQGPQTALVSFFDTSDNETGFVIERAGSADGPFTAVGTLPANNATTTQLEFFDTSVDFGQTYYYRVVAVSGGTRSAPSSVQSVTIPGGAQSPGTAPNGPYGLGLSQTSETQVQVLFYDNADNESSFVLQRADSSTGTFNTIANLFPSPGVGALNTFFDNTVVAGHTYAYRVFARNGPTFVSGTDGPASITLAPPGSFAGGGGSAGALGVPNGPYGLTFSLDALTPTSVRLSFLDNADNEAGFIVERSTAGGAFTPITSLPPSTGVGGRVYYTDTTVVAGTDYQYRVYAINGPYQSSIAGPASITTPSA